LCRWTFVYDTTGVMVGFIFVDVNYSTHFTFATFEMDYKIPFNETN